MFVKVRAVVLSITHLDKQLNSLFPPSPYSVSKISVSRHGDASFLFVNDYGPQLTIAYLTFAITDPSEAMTYPVCGNVPKSTMADPHTTVLQFSILNYIKIRIVGGQNVNMCSVALFVGMDLSYHSTLFCRGKQSTREQLYQHFSSPHSKYSSNIPTITH